MTVLKKYDDRIVRIANTLGVQPQTDRTTTRIERSGVMVEVSAASAIRHGAISFGGLCLTPMGETQWQVGLGEGKVEMVEKLAFLPMCQAPVAARPLLAKLAAEGL